ncbi:MULTISPECIES: response regulator [unclassified Rhizobium]|uniref:response regulator n=1 Tax=unclassified Rhizobium TaxID=2613769 RepID=UPI003862E4D0
MPDSQPVVLVVEDEPFLRLSTVADLEDDGFIVLEASSADEAIEIIEGRPDIQVIFTDIDMPGSMDGLRLAAFVRDRWPPIKIIITSGNNLPGASLPRDVPFMGKPYKRQDVTSAIRMIISQ